MPSYRNPQDRPTATPFSIPPKLADEFETTASELNTNRSELIRGLMRFFLSKVSSKDKKFIEELMKLVR